MEMWPILLTSLLIFTLIMVATRMLSITEWVVNQGVPPGKIIKMISYLLPNIILFAMPAASLLAVLIAFLRLSGDNEIIAMYSSGIGFYELLPPVLTLSAIAFFTASLVALLGIPWGNRSFKDLIFEIAETRAGLHLKERVFHELFTDVIIYINSIPSGQVAMKDVFIMDKRDPYVINTIVAKEGRILKYPESRTMTIHFTDGTIFMVKRDLSSARTIRFNSYDLGLDMNDFLPAGSTRKKAPREMFYQELVREMNSTNQGSIEYNEMAVELMERFSVPLAVFFMGMIGLPLGAQIRSGTRTVGIALGLCIFLIYSMCFMVVKGLCETGTISPYIGMWFPCIFLVISFVYLTKRAASDRPMILLSRMAF
jgi:lipopolysaccharide export system permease protein